MSSPTINDSVQVGTVSTVCGIVGGLLCERKDSTSIGLCAGCFSLFGGIFFTWLKTIWNEYPEYVQKKIKRGCQYYVLPTICGATIAIVGSIKRNK